MDKKEFLSALENSLSLLQEEELRDIVSEYEQHIDMKVAKGLTEAEAIADFGSLQELTGEILEAYHVRADYAAKTEKSRGTEKKIFEKIKSGGKQDGYGLWEKAKRAGDGLACSLKKGWSQLCGLFGRMGAWMASHTPWRRKWAAEEAIFSDTTGDGGVEAENGVWTEDERSGRKRRTGKTNIKEIFARKRGGKEKMRSAEVRTGIVGTGFNARAEGIGQIFRWGMEAALWGIRLVWNGSWLIFAVFTGAFGLFSLFGMGVLTVLLIQGYPLAGVTIGCMGVVLCMFSAAGLGMSLMWRRYTPKEADDEVIHKDEVNKGEEEDA